MTDCWQFFPTIFHIENNLRHPVYFPALPSLCEKEVYLWEYPTRITGLQQVSSSMAQLNARLTGDQEVAGSTPLFGNNHSWRIDHEIFSTVILSLPLIQEG